MHFEIYRESPTILSAATNLLAAPSQWRWRLVADNGRNIANGGESFHNSADCRASIGLVMGTTAATEVRSVGK